MSWVRFIVGLVIPITGLYVALSSVKITWLELAVLPVVFVYTFLILKWVWPEEKAVKDDVQSR